MHAIWFDLQLLNDIKENEVMDRIKKNPMIAVTYKKLSSLIFSFGRDHGYFGRILNQTVVVLPSLTIRNGNEVIGFCFTPQDGNSLLSNIAVIEQFLYNDSWKEKMNKLDSYQFSEV